MSAAVAALTAEPLSNPAATATVTATGTSTAREASARARERIRAWKLANVDVNGAAAQPAAVVAAKTSRLAKTSSTAKLPLATERSTLPTGLNAPSTQAAMTKRPTTASARTSGGGRTSAVNTVVSASSSQPSKRSTSVKATPRIPAGPLSSARRSRAPPPNIVVRSDEEVAASRRAEEIASTAFPDYFQDDSADLISSPSVETTVVSNPLPTKLNLTVQVAGKPFGALSPASESPTITVESVPSQPASSSPISHSSDGVPRTPPRSRSHLSVFSPDESSRGEEAASPFSPPSPLESLRQHDGVLPRDAWRVSPRRAATHDFRTPEAQPSLAQQEADARARLQVALAAVGKSVPAVVAHATTVSARVLPAAAVSPPATAASPAPDRYPYSSHISLTRTGMHPAIPRQYRRVNQDRLFMRKRLLSSRTDGDQAGDAFVTRASHKSGRKSEALFGVADGHGSFGGECAELVSHALLRFLSASDLESLTTSDKLATATLEHAFHDANTRLTDARHELDSSDSGCSALVLLLAGRRMHVASVGSCRAVLATLTNPADPTSLIAVPLSDDHRPRLDEQGRPDLSHEDTAAILAAGGVVDQCRDRQGARVGPPCIFAPSPSPSHHSPSRTQPPLLSPVSCLTRCFGSVRARGVGVSCLPSVRSRLVASESDQFVLLASDGLFSTLTDEEAVALVARAENPVEAARSLVRIAAERWLKEEDVVEDISVTIVYFHPTRTHTTSRKH